MISSANIDSISRKARNIAFKTGRQDQYDDLVSQGYLGLCESMQKYEPERGIPLEYYASKRIEGAMKDYLRKEFSEDYNTVDLCAPDGERNPVEEMLFNHFGRRRSMESEVNFRIAAECLIEVYRRLPDDEKDLLNIIYGEGASFRDIAKKMNVNASTVCRQHGRIIEKFRSEFIDRGLI
ncbi:MAG: sigma-70 family RNA polymerase sigma factor [Deltaproteobacteria bacterium]|nr:sigma-70 family RNA polymerase sigma factor [Deltaproteobacteria bacterium]